MDNLRALVVDLWAARLRDLGLPETTVGEAFDGIDWPRRLALVYPPDHPETIHREIYRAVTDRLREKKARERGLADPHGGVG